MWHWFENPLSDENRLTYLSPLDNNENICVVYFPTTNWGFPDLAFTTASAIEYVGLVEFGAYQSYDKTWNYQRQSFRYNPALNEDNNIFLSIAVRGAVGYDEYRLIANGYIYLDQTGKRWEVRISGLAYSADNFGPLPLQGDSANTRKAAIQGVNIYY